jgi:simple sugar transport system substrate-binding protein
MKTMTTWIRQYGDSVNCVYAENDNLADDTIQALREAGKKIGGKDGVAIISFDADRQYLQMTLEDLMNCNVECNPPHGLKVFGIIQMPESGRQPQKSMLIEEEAICWDTITQSIIDARQY